MSFTDTTINLVATGLITAANVTTNNGNVYTGNLIATNQVSATNMSFSGTLTPSVNTSLIQWKGGNPSTMLETYYGPTDRYGIGQNGGGTLRVYTSNSYTSSILCLGRYTTTGGPDPKDWIVCNSSGIYNQGSVFANGSFTAANVNATANIYTSGFVTAANAVITGTLTVSNTPFVNTTLSTTQYTSNVGLLYTVANVNTPSNIASTGNVTLTLYNFGSQYSYIDYTMPPTLLPGSAFSIQADYQYFGTADGFAMQLFYTAAGSLGTNVARVISNSAIGYRFGYNIFGTPGNNLFYNASSTSGNSLALANSPTALPANIWCTYLWQFDGASTWTCQVSNASNAQQVFMSNVIVDSQALGAWKTAAYPSTLRIIGATGGQNSTQLLRNISFTAPVTAQGTLNCATLNCANIYGATNLTAGNITSTGLYANMGTNQVLAWGTATIQNNMISLWGSSNPADTTSYGFGINSLKLVYNTPSLAVHSFRVNGTEFANIGATGFFSANASHAFGVATGNLSAANVNASANIYTPGSVTCANLNMYTYSGVSSYPSIVGSTYGGWSNGAPATISFVDNANYSCNIVFATKTSGASTTLSAPRLTITDTTSTFTTNLTAGNITSTGLYANMGTNQVLAWGGATIQNNMISLYGTSSPADGTSYGFGINSFKLVYNTPSTAVHSFRCANVEYANIGTSGISTGNLICTVANITAMPVVANTAPALANGQMTFSLVTNTSLKIFAKGTDGVLRSTTLTLA